MANHVKVGQITFSE